MLFGGVMLVLWVGLLIASWIVFRRGFHHWALFLLVLSSLLLRSFVSLDPYLHPWDERYHALVAKNMMVHPLVPTLYENPILPYDYKGWVGNHIWLHKQPVPLWGMSASIKLFGTSPFAVRLPSILLAGIGVMLSFTLGKRLFNARVGYFTAFFFAIHGLVSELVSGRMPTDHIDVYFTVFILLAIVAALRFAETKSIWWNCICGVAIGLAILTKWLPALIVLPVWLLFVLHHKFRFREWFLHGLMLVAIVCLIALPWQLYINMYFPKEASWERHFNVMHLYMNVENQGRPFWYFFDMMRMSYGELIYIPVVWFVYKAIQLKTAYYYWAIVVWLLVPYIFFSASVTKMQAYVLISAVTLFLMSAVFIDRLMDKQLLSKFNWLRVLVLALLILLPVRFAVERFKPFQSDRTVPVWQAEINKFARTVKHPKKTIVFNTQHPIEYMFHCDVIAYGGVPAAHVLDSLLSQRYEVYLVDGQERPVKWVHND